MFPRRPSPAIGRLLQPCEAMRQSCGMRRSGAWCRVQSAHDLKSLEGGESDIEDDLEMQMGQVRMSDVLPSESDSDYSYQEGATAPGDVDGDDPHWPWSGSTTSDGLHATAPEHKTGTEKAAQLSPAAARSDARCQCRDGATCISTRTQRLSPAKTRYHVGRPQAVLPAVLPCFCASYCCRVAPGARKA